MLKDAIINLTPGFIVRFFAKPYIGGYGIDNAIQKAEDYYNENHFYSTLDLLGESVNNREAVEFTMDVYKQLIAKTNKVEKATISIKPTAFGLNFDQQFAEEQIMDLVNFADKHNIPVTLDMEESEFVDKTLEMYKKLLKKHPNIGTVLQSRLFRTDKDIEEMKGIKGRFRCVIGIYNEPASIALTNKKEMKEKLIQQVGNLLEQGHYVEVGTHDEYYVKKIVDTYGEKYKDRLEFQFLLGVPLAKLQKELVDNGHKVRLYLPFVIRKNDATAYLKRRMKNNPHMIIYVIKNLFKIN